MISRLFHTPYFHLPSSHSEKKVTWLELFYDLIFVAAFIQLGNGLSNKITLLNFLGFGGIFLTLWVSWTGFTYFANRYTVDDFLHRVLVFSQMFAVGTMAITAPEVLEGNPTRFALAYTVSQAIVAALYFRAYSQQPYGRNYSKYWGTVFLFGSIMWLISTFFTGPLTYIFWAIGIAGIFTAVFIPYNRVLMTEFPSDMEHLSNRYGLLTIIVLGESFVKVILGLSVDGASISVLTQASATLLVTCCIWWIYFDDVAGSHLKNKSMFATVWLVAHIPVQLGITSLGVAIKKAIFFDLSTAAPYEYGWLLCGSLGLIFLGTAIIDSVTERKVSELSDKNRITVRFISALFLFILAEVSSSMTATWFLILIGITCIGQVVFDILMAPFEESPEMRLAVSTGDIARSNLEGGTPIKRQRINLENAIRKGTPGEFRKDIYFFLMDGSWTRVFISIFGLFLLINTVFAGLFMLQPDSISFSRPDSFADAFFFSVQTMSTIGYGTMSPVSTYGHIIVTIEAIFALLCVALMTGIMFAKASRAKASIIFSKKMILTKRFGKPALMFRAGNARGNDVIDATVSVSALFDEVTPEGEHLRRVEEIKLKQNKTPFFALSWSIYHEINEDSPFHNIDWNDPSQTPIAFLITLTGHDGTYNQTIYSRYMYSTDDIYHNYKFVDVLSQLPDGRLMIDYSKFHDIIPLKETT